MQKKVSKMCAVLAAICVIAAVTIVFLRRDSDLTQRFVEAGLFVLFPALFRFVMWAGIENDWPLFEYGWRWRNGRLGYGQVDYTSIPKERRKLIARIVTLFVAGFVLCIAILPLIKH